MSLPRVARRDVGEMAIVSALRQAGAAVWLVSQRGLPDLLIGHRGRFVMFEVKGPKGVRGGQSDDGQHLNPEQERFFEECRLRDLPVFVVRSAEQALEAIGVGVAPPTGRASG